MANVDNLNFKVILDDKDFNTKIRADIDLAKTLNAQLSTLLQAKVNLSSVSAQDAANAKRHSDIITHQAVNQEKIRRAAAQTAEAEEKVRTQAAKTATELQRANKYAQEAALAQQRTATEAQRTATQTQRAATEAQRHRTEVQRTATEAQRTATETQRTAAATSRAEAAQRRLANSSKQTTNNIRTQSRLMSELKGYVLGYLSIRGATQLISSLVRVTGEFELQKTTLAAMLGDLNQAEQIITRIQGLAVESPFQFKELTTYAKQLSAFSVPAEELYETTKMLADVSAGLGVGMDRIVLAYGQVRSAAFLRGQEVRQFTEAGIPILDELAKQFTELEGRAVSTGEVFDKISARLVPFEMVAKVFKDMTSEGGKFYNMQEVQAETLRGKISNLKDAYEIMLNEIGSQKSGAMKGAVDSLRSLMQNWERVGAILKTVIISYGVYKATLASVWAYEKLMAGVEMYKRWQRMNQLLVATTGNTRKLATAMRVLGASSKGAVGVVLAAIAALVTIMARAISNASKLRKELESIMTSEVAGSDKAVDDLNRLVENLKKAKQGSQEYRDIISELNGKYDDYLPKILSEADAYDQVKVAADAAAEAIRNKAKANAFEKGSAAIEDDFGKRLTKRTTSLRDALTNMYDTNGKQISKEIASEFIKNFNIALAQEGAMDDIEATIKKAFDNYFGEGKFEEYKLNFALGTFEFSAKEYAKVRSEVIAAEKDLQSDLDARFGDAQFSSLKEREKIAEVEAWYRKEEDALKKLTLTQAEYNKKIQELDINKLRKLVTAYEEMGRSDVAAAYQKQIDALTKIPEGWRGKVQSVLKGMGLTKGSSFGLWAEDTTQSTTYVDEMVKRYKELAEQIKMVSPFDEEQTKRLQQNKDAIEAVSKALGINIKELAASKSEKVESVAERQLKAEIDLVKKLQDSYGKLSDFLSADQMKATLANLFPEAKKEWIESLDFSEILRKMADELEKYDKEAAERLRASVGKDMAGDIASVFKAIEQYKKTLESWMGEDFNLTGEGVTFDISKIISDLNNQYAKINEKAIKASNLLTEAQMGDEEALKVVREVYGEEVWQKYLANGQAVIDELARKEREASRKTADEKIRDLSDQYVSEQMEKKNVNLTDFEDKSIAQVQSLIDRMKEIKDEAKDLAEEALLDVLLGKIDDGQYAKWQMLLDVLEQLDQKIKDTEEEKKKKQWDNVLAGADAVSQLSGEISGLGEALGNAEVSKFGKDLKEATDTLSGVLKAFEDGDTISMVTNIVSYAISQITDIFTEAYNHQRALIEASKEYRDIMIEIRREAYSGIFGTDEMALASENTKILAERQKEYEDIVKRIQKIKFQQFGGSFWRKNSIEGALQEAAASQGWELFLEDGTYNIQALEAYFDAYSSRLTRKQRDMVQELIDSGKDLNDALAQQAQYLTDLFSGVADDIASSMVDAFIESGDAAIDMGNYVSDIAKKMMADLIRSVYLMPILNEYQAKAEEIQKNTALTPTQKAELQVQELENALYEISSQSDAISDTIARFEDYYRTDEGGTKDLGEGIKGITEDTANLLASYLNAIRADVSYSKMLWERMDSSLQRIADILTSSPTLMEYQAQIAANTYNTAITTQDILAELRSVITTDSGDTAIRVYS